MTKITIGRAFGFTTEPVRSSQRGDGLTNAIIGIVLTSLFAVGGIGYYLNALASGTTAKAETVMQDLATNITSYYGDNGAYPAAAWPQTANSYLKTIPVDPQTSTNTSAFSITQYTDASGSPGYYVDDAVQHGSQTLAKLPKWTAAGANPAGLCGPSGCKNLVYDPSFGMMGK